MIFWLQIITYQFGNTPRLRQIYGQGVCDTVIAQSLNLSQTGNKWNRFKEMKSFTANRTATWSFQTMLSKTSRITCSWVAVSHHCPCVTLLWNLPLFSSSGPCRPGFHRCLSSTFLVEVMTPLSFQKLQGTFLRVGTHSTRNNQHW